jgi:EAL domain-containing protein (putative c-di-GMP-specific phosphodiesterase class I)
MEIAEPANGNSLHNLIRASGMGQGVDGVVKRVLAAMRAHLGMEVAYVSEFEQDRVVLREVVAPAREDQIQIGFCTPLESSFCYHVREGLLPELITDISAEPVAMALPVTQQHQIGRHMSVPIRLQDGSIFGMFCCFGHAADPSLHERDLQVMKAFADLMAFEISRDVEVAKAAQEKRLRIQSVIEENLLSIVYQPIWDIATGRLMGVECLSRIATTPYRTPDKWFAEAAEAGLGVALELTAIRTALATLSAFPADAYLTVNISPATLLSGEFPGVFEGIAAGRIILELTEQTDIEDYDGLLAALQPLRTRGLRLAVDDAGAGYSSLQRILYLQPEVIKLDTGFTRNIDRDPMRRALASALIQFAQETNRRIVAEGVETEIELNTLKKIGVDRAQGYFLGRPMPLADVLKLFAPESAWAGAV